MQCYLEQCDEIEKLVLVIKMNKLKEFLKEEKAQAGMEILILIAGALLVAAIVGIIIKKNVIGPVTKQIQGQPVTEWKT